MKHIGTLLRALHQPRVMSVKTRLALYRLAGVAALSIVLVACIESITDPILQRLLHITTWPAEAIFIGMKQTELSFESSALMQRIISVFAVTFLAVLYIAFVVNDYVTIESPLLFPLAVSLAYIPFVSCGALVLCDTILQRVPDDSAYIVNGLPRKSGELVLTVWLLGATFERRVASKSARTQ